MRHAASLLLASSLLLLYTACEGPACEDCFVLDVGQADSTFGACCTYTRTSQADQVLVRIERVAGGDYLAGLGVGCSWAAGAPYDPSVVTVDGGEVGDTAAFDVPLEVGDPVILGVDCDPARPEPAYPDVILRLLDPDLEAQFDPEGAAAGEASLVLVSDPI